MMAREIKLRQQERSSYDNKVNYDVDTDDEDEDDKDWNGASRSMDLPMRFEYI